MSNHEEQPQESPKRVYFGIPIAFALSFWFIGFLSLKACNDHKSCCDSKECSKECMEKCKAEGKTWHLKGAEVKKEKEGENVLENVDHPANSTLRSSDKEGNPDSPNGVKGEKSP